jgi:hypothetical protein
MSGKPDDEHPLEPQLEPQLEDILDAVRSSEGEPQDAEKIEHVEDDERPS